MLNQEFYGKMRPRPPVPRNSPVAVPCSKCKGMFILEKKHTEVYLIKFYFGRTKEGTLTPGRQEPNGYYRLCPSCENKLKEWFENKNG